VFITAAILHVPLRDVQQYCPVLCLHALVPGLSFEYSTCPSCHKAVILKVGHMPPPPSRPKQISKGPWENGGKFEGQSDF
jgi:hypothetical protein